MRSGVALAIAAAATIASAPPQAQPVPSRVEGRTVIAAGTLLDGRGAVLHDTRVVVEGSTIVAIDPKAGPVDYDLRRATLMPGWIDTHVHINWHFDESGRSVSGGDVPEQAALYAAENAWLTLRGGFTTVQSVGAAIDKAVRDRIDRGLLPGPRVLTSLRQIQNRNGPPDVLRALVRQTKTEGGDVIKLFATSGLGAGGAQTMTDEQIEAVCGEAKAAGLRAVVHAIGDAGARAAVLAGCTAIEHGTLLSDATLDLMAERRTYLDPNLLVLHNYLDAPTGFAFTEQTLAALRAAIEPTAAMFGRARARHVKIVFGTDAVAGAHGRNAEEFVYRVREAHEKPMDVLISGTSLAAESLGLGDRIGAVAPGMEADLVATAANPMDDIASVRRVVFVMKGGRVYRLEPAAASK